MYLTRDVLGDIDLADASATPTPVSTYGTIRARFRNDDGTEGTVTLLLDAPISINIHGPPKTGAATTVSSRGLTYSV
jgi:hypothetical protein